MMIRKHDDQVDALGLVGQLLDKMGSGRKLTVEDFKGNQMAKDPYQPYSLPLDGFKTM